MAAATGVHFDLETLRSELAEVQAELRDWADAKVDGAQSMLQKQEEFMQSSEQARTELESREAALVEEIQSAQKSRQAMAMYNVYAFGLERERERRLIVAPSGERWSNRAAPSASPARGRPQRARSYAS